MVGGNADSKDGRLQDLSGVDTISSCGQKVLAWCFEGASPFSIFFPFSIFDFRFPTRTQAISSRVLSQPDTEHGTADTSASPSQTAQPAKQQQPGDETSQDLPCSMKSMDEGARRAMVRMAL